MALKKTITTVHGIEVKNAYCRVEGLVLENKNKIKFRVRSSIDGEHPHFSDEEYSCEYDLSGENPIKQAYKYLKTLPAFDGATDC
jgi:hypothetical protein